MRTRVKICGISTPEMAQAAMDAGADAIGLVFAEGSPRTVSLEMAETIVDELPAFVEPVGVFLNQPVDFIRDVAGRLHLRTVQLHGRETPRQAAALAPRRVIKAFSFDAEGIEATLEPWRRCSNLGALMLDSPPPPSASAANGLTGGHGTSFDWESLAAVKRRGVLADMPPLILAGGLNAENVARAITALLPYAVDVSSGVEISRGVKDAQLITSFCQTVQVVNRNA